MSIVLIIVNKKYLCDLNNGNRKERFVILEMENQFKNELGFA